VLPPNLENTDDEALILAVQGGNPQAFEPLLDRHLTHVRACIALRAPVSQLVDELAHDTFVYAYQNIHKFTAGTSFRAWLRAIAWNLLRAEIQRFSREQAHQDRLASLGAEEAVLEGGEAQVSREAECLEECVKQLPAPMRGLLTLKYTDERSTDDIARRLQRSLAWVRTVLFRLRGQLKLCIEEKLGRQAPC